MKKYLFWLPSVCLLISCSTMRRSASATNDRKIEICFVQVNDVYEIAPLSGGREGGVARLASIKKKYQQRNPLTLMVIAGDFVGPSVYQSLQYEGKPIRGRQMVAALNAAGMDLACFGNHEFDIKESELQERINESDFKWISSNCFHKTKSGTEAFHKNNTEELPATYILNVQDADGTTARIGFIGLCLPFNRADYVSYTDPISTAKELYDRIKDSVDAVVAITHQSMEDDRRLANAVPGLAAILGGHEHDQHFEKVNGIYITKAMANAKSAFAVTLRINTKKHRIKTEAKLEVLNESIPLDEATNAVVQQWTRIAENNYASLGFDAKKIVMEKGEPLDAREVMIRARPTNFTRLVAAAIRAAAPKADVVLMNSGSIRVDDVLQMPVTQYDIIRALPFGGSIREVDMKGRLLLKVLEQGKLNVGNGGFLIYNEAVSNEGGGWKIGSEAVDPVKTYHVAMADFLLTGKEANLDFLNPSNPDMVKVYPEESRPDPRADIRLALIHYLENMH